MITLCSDNYNFIRNILCICDKKISANKSKRKWPLCPWANMKWTISLGPMSKSCVIDSDSGRYISWKIKFTSNKNLNGVSRKQSEPSRVHRDLPDCSGILCLRLEFCSEQQERWPWEDFWNRCYLLGSCSRKYRRDASSFRRRAWT